jgi:hypothetical protein
VINPVTHGIAVLKAPSGGLLAGRLADPRFWQSFIREAKLQDELRSLYRDMVRIACPLAYVRDGDTLDRTLKSQIPRYLIWKGKIYALLLSMLDQSEPTDFIDRYCELNHKALTFLRERASLYLSQEDVERLLDAAKGAELYSESLLRTLLLEGPQALDPEVLQATIELFVQADLLLLTVTLLLERQLRRFSRRHWVTPALELLVRKADKLIETIEDELIIHDPELKKRLEAPANAEHAVPLEEYLRQRGLA